MPVITYQGKEYECDSEESLLDGINRQGGNLPFGCRSGLCQGCMVKAVKGEPTAISQSGVKPMLKKKGYFLSCLCKPETDLEITQPDRRDEFLHCNIIALDYLNDTVIRLRVSRPSGFSYRPGQFVNIIRPEDGLARSYSLASIPSDDHLEFHIRLLADGKMSRWIANNLEHGSEILISEAMGDCCYREVYSERPLLLAGAGTGLAPIYGILRDAIASGHQAHIRLIHGGLSTRDLYLDTALRKLADQHGNISYIPSVLHGEAPEGGVVAPIDILIPDQLTCDSNWAAYLCGDATTVSSMRRNCFSHGVDESSIHSDAFG